MIKNLTIYNFVESKKSWAQSNVCCSTNALKTYKNNSGHTNKRIGYLLSKVLISPAGTDDIHFLWCSSSSRLVASRDVEICATKIDLNWIDLLSQHKFQYYYRSWMTCLMFTAHTEIYWLLFCLIDMNDKCLTFGKISYVEGRIARKTFRIFHQRRFYPYLVS